MEKVNRLSRRPNWQEVIEKDNKNQTLIKVEWIRGVKILVKKGDLREKIKKAQEEDEKVVKKNSKGQE